MEAPPCPFLLPKHLHLEQMAWKSPLHSRCHPQPCPTWILRSKTRPISVVSSSPWAKVKGFALRVAENTGLAWELPGVARTLHQCFRSSSYWFSVTKHFRKKVEIVYVWCGSFISVLLSGSFSFFLFFPLLQSNSNLGLLIKTFNSLLYFEVSLENMDKFEVICSRRNQNVRYEERSLERGWYIE